jgi:hypothetical protein
MITKHINYYLKCIKDINYTVQDSFFLTLTFKNERINYLDIIKR